MALSYIQYTCCLFGHKYYRPLCYCLLTMGTNGVYTVYMGAQSAIQQLIALNSACIEVLIISLVNMSMYTTSQTCIHCLADLTCFLLVALELQFMSPLSTLQDLEPLKVSRVDLPSIETPAGILNSISSNTSLLVVFISSKTQCVLICDLSNLTF
jgi:hypothetical protein